MDWHQEADRMFGHCGDPTCSPVLMDSEIVRQEHVDTDCEILYAETWWTGIIKAWRLHKDGTWSAWVKHDSPDGNRISTVPAASVRPIDEQQDIGPDLAGHVPGV